MFGLVVNLVGGVFGEISLVEGRVLISVDVFVKKMV